MEISTETMNLITGPSRTTTISAGRAEVERALLAGICTILRTDCHHVAEVVVGDQTIYRIYTGAGRLHVEQCLYFGTLGYSPTLHVGDEWWARRFPPPKLERDVDGDVIVRSWPLPLDRAATAAAVEALAPTAPSAAAAPAAAG